MDNQTPEVWIATVEISPRPGNTTLEKALGAFVSVLSMASGPRNFRRKIYEFMENPPFDVLDISDAEPLELRLEFTELSNELTLLAKEVKLTGQTRAGTYEAYSEDDEV